MNKKEKTKLSVEETLNITNGIIENMANTWGEKHPAYELNEKLNETKISQEEGMVKVFCTPKDDTDKLATEVSIRGTKIYPPEGFLIGKITPIDNSFFVEFVEKDDYIKNYRDKLNDVGLTGFKKDIIIDTNNKMTKAGFPPCKVSDIMSDTPLPKGEINHLDEKPYIPKIKVTDEDIVVENALEAIYDNLNLYNSAFSNGLNREEVINKIKERLH